MASSAVARARKFLAQFNDSDEGHVKAIVSASNVMSEAVSSGKADRAVLHASSSPDCVQYVVEVECAAGRPDAVAVRAAVEGDPTRLPDVAKRTLRAFSELKPLAKRADLLVASSALPYPVRPVDASVERDGELLTGGGYAEMRWERTPSEGGAS